MKEDIEDIGVMEEVLVRAHTNVADCDRDQIVHLIPSTVKQLLRIPS